MDAGAGTFKVLPYVRGKETDILALLSSAMGETIATPRTQAFWNWKHIENPFGYSYGLCAWDEEEKRVLSLRMLMRWLFNTPRGSTISAVRAVDTVTHPDCQRKGLFTILTTQAIHDLSAENVHLIFNTPNEKSLPGYLKMGWRNVHEWPMFIRLLRPGRFLFNAVFNHDFMPGKIPPWNSFFGKDMLPWISFRELYGDDVGKIIEIWENVRTRKEFRTIRTPAYCDWRYGRHPSVTYGVLPLEDEKRLAAFAVIRPNIRYGTKEAVLTDMFLRGPDAGLAARLMRGLTMNLNADYIIAHFAEGSFESKMIRRSLFFRIPGKGMIFTVRALNDSAGDLFNEGSWDLTLGDLEVF